VTSPGDQTDPDLTPGCWDCSDHPIDKLQVMFVNMLQMKRMADGDAPARRPVFLKLHGGAHGEFVIRKDLDTDEAERLGPLVGVFRGDRFPAWVRFSSDTVPGSPDLRTTCGIAIKLFGVDGERVDLPSNLPEAERTTQDFLLQNHDVFFVDDATEFCEFTAAAAIHGPAASRQFLEDHPETKAVLDAMARLESSVLAENYWSVLPYRFGEGRFVKYKLEPEVESDGGVYDDPDYLGTDLARRLMQGEVRFRFMVQPRSNQEGRPPGEDTMPLDRATHRWDESESAPIQVATLVLNKQDILTRGQSEYVEHLSFNPWRTLKVHAPAEESTLNLARRQIYLASASTRRHANGVPDYEPARPRPEAMDPAPIDDSIASVSIHPAIGIARVGNSHSEFFYGPEVIDPPRPEPGFYRDAEGALKRQAARFRLYALRADGTVVRELTDADADITWSVHLANKKSAWYEFQLAQDIPEGKAAPGAHLRNAAVSDRERLIIDPGKVEIDAGERGDDGEYSCVGRFMDREVYLGELRTDEQGRLVVLGGRGVADTPEDEPVVTFANNDGWYDDISDGPVTATVSIRGREIPVKPAWVVVAPPNYAPMQKSVRTMWDLMRDVAIKAKKYSVPPRPSFSRDILPIFERLSRLQWVNAGFAAEFGWTGRYDFSDPGLQKRLSDSGPEENGLRRSLAKRFRRLDRDSWSPEPWPWLYGDAMTLPPAKSPRQHAVLSDTQLHMLDQWAEGNFIDDYDEFRSQDPPATIDEVSLTSRPDELDRAALDFCLADAFHPGCEMTWIVRDPRLYMAPFRFRHAPDGVQEGEPPQSLEVALNLPRSPLGPQFPGGITRWMAVPWHTDTASCRSGLTRDYDPHLPAFWPARAPNQVLAEDDYRTVMDENEDLEARMAAFATRWDWNRTLGSGSYLNQLEAMIRKFADMGVVEPREGPTGRDSEYFPSRLEVEDLEGGSRDDAGAASEAPDPPSGADDSAEPHHPHPSVRRHHAEGFDPKKVEKFNRYSEEDLDR